ncbi:MAG TPA: hypothetical protein PLJ62_08895 [Thermoflexales bacterium]|nr:hypothetical protein [Thermoflexales bacterium]HRA00303.1 hypothetical protein [Thermoflexales bacterium]
MISLLFAVLVLLPIVGAAAHIVVGRFAPIARFPRPAQHFILPAAAIGAVLCALALFGFGGEAIVGGWMPVSLVGAPLLISIAPPTAALVTALACVGLAQAIRSHGQTDVVVAARALAFAALMLTTLAANMLTLFVGMGLVELFTLLASAQTAPDQISRRDVFRHAIFQVGSLLLLAMGFLISVAAQSSLYFALATISLRSTPFFAAALLLRALSLLLYPGAIANRFGPIATLVLLMRLLDLNNAFLTPGIALVVLIASVITLIRAAITQNASDRNLLAQTGAFLLIMLPHPADPAAWVAASASAWLLSAELIEHPAPIARLIGALSLFGVPLSAGFIARSGAVPATANIPAFIIWCVAMALLAFSLFQLVRGAGQPRLRLLSGLAGSPQSLISFGVMALPLIALGVLPQALGLPNALALVSRQGLADWLAMAFAAGAGVLLAIFSPRWAGRATRQMQMAEQVFKFRWLEDILEGSVNRIAAPFRAVFTFLESPGVLLWAIVAALLAVLISRPGGP